MRRLAILLALLMGPLRPCAAWNPLTDLKENIIWTFGKKAEIGTAIKLCGAGDLSAGETATSLLSGMFDYRWFSFSYGGTRVNKAGSDFTDTGKVGLRLTSFFDWFTHPPTPEMSWMRNVNAGPSLAMPILSPHHDGALFFDFNYTFGN